MELQLGDDTAGSLQHNPEGREGEEKSQTTEGIGVSATQRAEAKGLSTYKTHLQMVLRKPNHLMGVFSS